MSPPDHLSEGANDAGQRRYLPSLRLSGFGFGAAVALTGGGTAIEHAIPPTIAVVADNETSS